MVGLAARVAVRSWGGALSDDSGVCAAQNMARSCSAITDSMSSARAYTRPATIDPAYGVHAGPASAAQLGWQRLTSSVAAPESDSIGGTQNQPSAPECPPSQESPSTTNKATIGPESTTVLTDCTAAEQAPWTLVTVTS